MRPGVFVREPRSAPLRMSLCASPAEPSAPRGRRGGWHGLGAPGALQLAARPAAAALPSRLAPFPPFGTPSPWAPRPPFPGRLTAWARRSASPASPALASSPLALPRPPSIRVPACGHGPRVHLLPLVLSNPCANPAPRSLHPHSRSRVQPAPTCLRPGRVARCGAELWGAGFWTPARGHAPLPPPPGLYRNVPPASPGAGAVIRMLISNSPRLGKGYQAPAPSTPGLPGCWTWAISFCSHNVDRMGKAPGARVKTCRDAKEMEEKSIWFSGQDLFGWAQRLRRWSVGTPGPQSELGAPRAPPHPDPSLAGTSQTGRPPRWGSWTPGDCGGGNRTCTRAGRKWADARLQL